MSAVDTSPRVPAVESPALLDQAPPAGPDRTRLWIEVGVVLLVAVIPDLGYAIWSMIAPEEPARSLIDVSLSHVLRSIQVIPPVLYLMWRSGEGWRAFGVVRPHVGLDVVGAALVLFCSMVVSAAYSTSVGAWLWALEGGYESSTPYTPAATRLESLCYAAATVVSALSEELIIWGFLFTRLRLLLGSPVQAIGLAAAVFASYHVYHGLAGIGAVFVAGLLHGVVFQVWPRLWPLVLSHAAWNILVAG